MEVKGDLTLQALRTDRNAGITVENSQFYSEIKEIVAGNSKMGNQNEFSLYPYDVIEKADGSYAVLTFVINRLGKPIQNIVFDFTLGNKKGEYVFKEIAVELTEEYMGVLQMNGVVPVLITLDKEDIDLFYSLDQSNVFLKMDNFNVDFGV